MKKVKENHLLSDDIDPKSFSRSQLLELLSEIDNNQENPIYEVFKVSGFDLRPTAMSTTTTAIVVADGPSRSVFSITLTGSTRLEGCATQVFSVDSDIRAIATRENDMFVITALGLSKFSSAEGCILWKARKSLSGVCANASTVAVSDKSGKIFRLEGKELVHLSGNESTDLKTLDAFSLNASHAQPGPLCIEQGTIFVCDQASLTIRLITDIKPLLKYHRIISKVYESFSIHSEKLGFKNVLHCDTVINNLKVVCRDLDSIVDGVRQQSGKLTCKPNGPQGSVPYMTVEMFHNLKENIQEINSILTNYSYSVKPVTLLSTPVEHHFSTMRSRYQMPTLLQYADHLSSVVREHVKRTTVTSYKYYTAKKSYYPNPNLLDLPPLPQTALPTSQAIPTKSRNLSTEERQLLLNWRSDFCAGVRQKTVRQLSTMDNPGTLPIFAYDNTPSQTYNGVILESEALVAVIPEDADDITLADSNNTISTRTGRVSQRKKDENSVFY